MFDARGQILDSHDRIDVAGVGEPEGAVESSTCVFEFSLRVPEHRRTFK